MHKTYLLMCEYHNNRLEYNLLFVDEVNQQINVHFGHSI